MLYNDVAKGYALAVLGVVILSPDALLIRLADLPAVQFAAWRALFSGLMVMTLAINMIGGKAIWHSLTQTGIYSPLLIMMNFIGSAAFVVAISYTSTSNALVLLACSPVISAMISRFWLGERLPLWTWLTILVCVGSIMLIFWQDFHHEQLLGSLAALVAATMLASVQVTLRMVRQHNMVACVGLGYLSVPLLFGIFYGCRGEWSTLTVMIEPVDWLYLLLNGLISGGSFYLLSNAPRYITAPEVGLVMLLESLLGSLLVWWFVHEAPSQLTIMAGSITLLVLAMHGYWRLHHMSSLKSITTVTPSPSSHFRR